MVIRHSIKALSLTLGRSCEPLWWRSPWVPSARGVSTGPVNGQDDDLKVQYLDGPQAGIVVLGLNRPQAKNSFSKNLVRLLSEAVEAVRFDKNCKVTIVYKYLTNCHSSHYEGGGLEMAIACDLRVAADSAKMGLVETKLAIIPGAGGTQRLPRLVGPALAKELIFTAKVLNGADAAKFGLVNHSVEQNKAGDAAFERSLALAEQIIPNGPVGVRMAKVAINRGNEVDLSTGLAIEEACYAQVIPTKDRLE
ncbi:hypothetical protein TCAL_01459, partial [Tigriopus californicus]